jgi:hypothetical protein
MEQPLKKDVAIRLLQQNSAINKKKVKNKKYMSN